VRWNLKEAVSKSLVRRTEITYKARLREISWQNTTKSNNYHICSSRVNVAYIWRERACTLSVEYQWSFIWMLRLIKLDNLAINVQLDKEKYMEKEQRQTEPEMAEAE